MSGQEGWPNRKKIVLACCDCAELTLSIFEKKYPYDKRPRVAIETARDWVAGKATLEQVKNAAASATIANTATAASATAYTAYAAYAAAATAYAAYAADAADAVADAAFAAFAISRAETFKQCANICRKRLKVPSSIKGEK